MRLRERLGTIAYYSTPEWSRQLLDRVPITVQRRSSVSGGQKKAFDLGVSFGLRMAGDRAQSRGHSALRAQLETLAHEWPTLRDEQEPLATVHRLFV